MRFETFRYLGAKAAAMKRPLRSSDAIMAYCNAQLPPDRHQPARMPKSHRSYDPVDGMELGVLITKALYGLVPSGNDWNREVNSFIVKPRSEGGLGMVRSCADPCYYHWARRAGVRCYWCPAALFGLPTWTQVVPRVSWGTIGLVSSRAFQWYRFRTLETMLCHGGS